MNVPALSVAIPNYNHAQYLPRCLDSILSQSVQPFEILVLDDASTDNSVAIIQRYASQHPHVRLHRNEHNLGAVANINQAFELSQGDYVFVPSADDEVVPGFFEKSLKLQNIDKFHYGPMATIGYKWFGVSAFYQISSVFQKDLGPQIAPISL